MTKAELFFTNGSPFARLFRILITEWYLPVTCVELDHPLPNDFFAQNPMGQVPLLKTVGESIFPSLPIAEQLWAMTEGPIQPFYDPMEHRQLLSTIFAMFDVMITARQIEWSGLTETSENKLGYTLQTRHLERVQHTLTWLDGRLNAETPGLCEYAVACLILWTESRGKIEWRDRANIVKIVDTVQGWPSFIDTAPAEFR